MPPDALLDAVVMLVKNALAPLQERLAAVETRQAILGDVRDRVVTLEVKGAIVVPPPIPDPPVPVDLSPVLERLAAVETHQTVLGDVRDRVVTLEAKAVPVVAPAATEPSPAVDLTPVQERLAAVEARYESLGDVRDRVVTLEVKAAAPVEMPAAVDLTPVLSRLSEAEQRLGLLARAPEFISEIAKDLGAVRERLAVVETRTPVAGPPGPAGTPGRDGVNGRDGADGVTLDDLAVAQIDDRTLVVKATVGAQVKEVGTLTLPVDIYRGVWIEGKSYERGDGVTWAGSEWHCHAPTTTKPGDGSKDWTLKVKRGRDGRDGKDAPGALPVVTVGRPRA